MMKTNAEIQELFLDYMADAFMKDRAEIAENLDLRFREDYAANSIMYFPMLGGLEEDLGIEINLRDFQNECHTVREGIDYVIALYNKAAK